MHHVFRRFCGPGFCLAAIFAMLVATAPGCGGGSQTSAEEEVAIPATLKQSNDNMENFMKSKNAAKKKR